MVRIRDHREDTFPLFQQLQIVNDKTGTDLYTLV